MLEKMPAEYKGKEKKQTEFTKTSPREWTTKEIEWVKEKHNQGYSAKEIAESVDRSETSISIKIKRLSKENNTYNEGWRNEKYFYNSIFLNDIKPKNILDLYSGKKSYYEGMNATTNDIDINCDTTYHLDAFALLCKLNYENKKYEFIDLDPFGSAYECFDLALRIATKGIAITFGEIGHKRWKRLDYVSKMYGINSLDDFTTDNLIKEAEKIALRHNKKLIVFNKCEWRNISRVWFKIETVEKQETRVKENKKE